MVESLTRKHLTWLNTCGSLDIKQPLHPSINLAAHSHSPHCVDTTSRIRWHTMLLPPSLLLCTAFLFAQLPHTYIFKTFSTLTLYFSCFGTTSMASTINCLTRSVQNKMIAECNKSVTQILDFLCVTFT